MAVTRDGQVFLARETIRSPADELPESRDLLTNKLDKTVYIKADARAQYRKVEDVVDNLRAAGVDESGLLTEQIRRG